MIVFKHKILDFFLLICHTVFLLSLNFCPIFHFLFHSFFCSPSPTLHLSTPISLSLSLSLSHSNTRTLLHTLLRTSEFSFFLHFLETEGLRNSFDPSARRDEEDLWSVDFDFSSNTGLNSYPNNQEQEEAEQQQQKQQQHMSKKK